MGRILGLTEIHSSADDSFLGSPQRTSSEERPVAKGILSNGNNRKKTTIYL
jgi:hypothetical protein